jgi:hypothetical protein
MQILQSKLFGDERGALPGIDRHRIAKFESAQPKSRHPQPVNVYIRMVHISGRNQAPLPKLLPAFSRNKILPRPLFRPHPAAYDLRSCV